MAFLLGSGRIWNLADPEWPDAGMPSSMAVAWKSAAVVEGLHPCSRLWSFRIHNYGQQEGDPHRVHHLERRLRQVVEHRDHEVGQPESARLRIPVQRPE